MIMMKVELMMIIKETVFSFWKTLYVTTNLPKCNLRPFDHFLVQLHLRTAPRVLTTTPGMFTFALPRGKILCSAHPWYPYPPDTLVFMMIMIIVMLPMYKILIGSPHWRYLLPYHSLKILTTSLPKQSQATGSDFIISSNLYFNDRFWCDVSSSELRCTSKCNGFTTKTVDKYQT